MMTRKIILDDYIEKIDWTVLGEINFLNQ